MSLEQQLKNTGSILKEKVDTHLGFMKPHLPVLSRFLIVATFYEDALRMIFQWSDQIAFLQDVKHRPKVVSCGFLLYNIFAMLVFSSTLVAKRHVPLSVGVLTSVILSQAVGYGIALDPTFFMRNLSILGGMLLCFADSLLRNRSRNNLFASIPTLSATERHQYIQLAGRVLLIVLFLGAVFQGDWSPLRYVASVLGFIACVMIAVGFKAKWSASFLVACLCATNILINNWWSRSHQYARDVARYDFFQCTSIMGGLLLLISMGPGELSYDEKKKEF